MSTPEAVATAAPDAPARPRRKLWLIAAALLLAGIGGGLAAAFSGLLPMGGSGQPAGPPQPELVLEEGSTAANPRYKTSYLRLDGAFTTNLANSPRFVQVEIGVATRYDARVLDRVRAHELAIRSAVLAVLAETSEELVTTARGRALLQRRLRDAINGVLLRKEGFGGIDEVHFTGLVVQ